MVLAFADSLRGGILHLAPLDIPERPPAAVAINDAIQRPRCAPGGVPSATTGSPPVDVLTQALGAARTTIDYENRPDHRRTWVLMSLITAVVRGVIVDNLVTDSRGFRSVNDEDFGEWICATAGIRMFSNLRSCVAFMTSSSATRTPTTNVRPAPPAVFLIGMALFGYKGSIFWKMTAGMGDVVIAPLYQALRHRGVEFEFFHRVDALHLDDRRQRVSPSRSAVRSRSPVASHLRAPDHRAGTAGIP